MPVQAKALEVVDQVVARRNAREKLVHFRSALFAWIEVRSGHRLRSVRQILTPCDPNLPAGPNQANDRRKYSRLLLAIGSAPSSKLKTSTETKPW